MLIIAYCNCIEHVRITKFTKIAGILILSLFSVYMCGCISHFVIAIIFSYKTISIWEKYGYKFKLTKKSYQLHCHF